jgi:hypothetical protein
MRNLYGIVALLLIASSALADDYNRIIRLEQDVRDLERQVNALQREMSDLRQRGARAGTPSNLEETALAAPDAWIDAEKWQRLKIGASELEVIEALGAPTSMRVQDGTRVLLYAMEIGSSGFLSGSVTLKDREVIAIELPTLK